jgi:hypothetical protein
MAKMSEPDFKSPEFLEPWFEEQRSETQAYLQKEGAVTGDVGERPAWYMAPYVAVWAIESWKSPDWVGWWVISGDLPTDYLSSQGVGSPRDAVRAFAKRWSTFVTSARAGETTGDYSLGSEVPSSELCDLLEGRAELLSELSEDESVWEDL